MAQRNGAVGRTSDGKYQIGVRRTLPIDHQGHGIC